MSNLPPIDTNPNQFWSSLDELLAASQVVIDRPKGTAHPRYPEMIYPCDYGYLQGTTAIDGSGVDLFAGTLPGRGLDAVLLTVDNHKKDVEIKLLLGCSEAEKQIVLAFLNGGLMSASLVRRDAQASLRSRRSVRRFQTTPVQVETLQRVLETAVQAPSSHNRQPWRFVILSTQQARQSLAEEMGADFRRDLLADGLAPGEVEAQVSRSRQRILEAPAAILLCLDPSTGDAYPDPARQQAELLMGAQGVAMAGENLLLAAHAEGLGGVWICAPLFAPAAVRRSLQLPDTWLPQGLVLLGYPQSIPEARLRRGLDEVTLWK